MPKLSPHNSLFRAAFGQPGIAGAFLRAALPEALADRLDFSTIEPRPEHFVDPKLADRETDLLFRVRINGREGYVYLLFEHQSTVDRMMAWRSLQYLVRIWDGWRHEHPKAERLPLIVPIVLYHGRHRWTAPLDFQQLVGDSMAELEGVRAQVPAFSYLLFDLRRMTGDEILGLASSAAVRLLLLILKHVHDERLPELLVGWHALVREAVLTDPTGLRLLELLLAYLAATGRGITEQDLADCGRAAGPTGKEIAMTLAQQLRKEGIKDGIEQGKRDLLLQMLRLKFGDLPDWAEPRVQAGTTEEVRKWAERILTAGSVDEVLS